MTVGGRRNDGWGEAAMESAGIDSGFRRNDGWGRRNGGWGSWYGGWGSWYDGEYDHTAWLGARPAGKATLVSGGWDGRP